jgi:hypothetical protein
MTEYFALITTTLSGLSIGDIVQLKNRETGDPILTYIQPPNNIPYSLGVVIGVEPDNGPFYYHDVIGLKCQERRVFPLECITKYSCNGNELETFKNEILIIIENRNIGMHIPDLPARLKNSLHLS